MGSVTAINQLLERRSMSARLIGRLLWGPAVTSRTVCVCVCVCVCVLVDCVHVLPDTRLRYRL